MVVGWGGPPHLRARAPHRSGRVLVHAVRPHPDGTGPRDGEIRVPCTLLGGGQPSTLQGEPLHAETTAKGPAWRLPGSIGAHVWGFDAHGLAWDSPQADGSSE